MGVPSIYLLNSMSTALKIMSGDLSGAELWPFRFLVASLARSLVPRSPDPSLAPSLARLSLARLLAPSFNRSSPRSPLARSPLRSLDDLVLGYERRR